MSLHWNMGWSRLLVINASTAANLQYLTVNIVSWLRDFKKVLGCYQNYTHLTIYDLSFQD